MKVIQGKGGSSCGVAKAQSEKRQICGSTPKKWPEEDKFDFEREIEVR